MAALPGKGTIALASSIASAPGALSKTRKKVGKAASQFYNRKFVPPLSHEQVSNLTKDLSQKQHDDAIISFPKIYNEFMEKFIKSANPKVLDEKLNIEKTRVLQLLCEIRSKDVKSCAANMFSTLAQHNKDILASTSSNSTTNQLDILDFMASSHGMNNTITTANLIRNTIADNYNAIVNSADLKEKVQEFCLQLLIIHFYPTTIMYIIRENMISYINTIKTNRDTIINDPNSPIRGMIDTLFSDDMGGLAYVSPTEAGLSALASANSGVRGPMLYGSNFSGGAFNINTIKEYNNNAETNPYLNSSGTMFYNALTNFAVSISINNKKKLNERMIEYLKIIFVQQLNIITAGMDFPVEKDLKDAENALADKERELERDANGKDYIESYKKSKQHEQAMQELESNNDTTADKVRKKSELEESYRITYSAQIILAAETNPQIRDDVAIYANLARRLKVLEDFFTIRTDIQKNINTLLIDMFAPHLTPNTALPIVRANSAPAALVSANSLIKPGALRRTASEPIPITGVITGVDGEESDDDLTLPDTNEEDSEDGSDNGKQNTVGGSSRDDYDRVIRQIFEYNDIFVDTSLTVNNEHNYMLTIENSIVKGIGSSYMFMFPQQSSPVASSGSVSITSGSAVQSTAGGKRRTRRYKKRTGTRRQNKRRGTHRKRKNTTR